MSQFETLTGQMLIVIKGSKLANVSEVLWIDLRFQCALFGPCLKSSSDLNAYSKVTRSMRS